MAGISTFSSRARFTEPDGRLTREASQLIETLIALTGGQLGFHGDEVFASADSSADASQAFVTEVSLQPAGDAPHMAVMLAQPESVSQPMAPMDMQPASPERMFAPVELQQASSAPMQAEMVMQPPSDAGPFMAITPGASPYAYTANRPGALSVQAGTISAITVTRGATAVTVTGATLIPANTGDIVTITYTVAPTVNFLPR